MKQPLCVVHVEDSEHDCQVVRESLSNEGLECEINRVETHSQLIDALTGTACDLVLSDYRLARFDGLDALTAASTLRPEVPFIFVSETIGEEIAVECVKRGAADYVLKDRIARLGPTVRRAMAETEDRIWRRETERRVRQAVRLQVASNLASGVAHEMLGLLATINEQVLLLGQNDAQAEPDARVIQTLERTANRGYELMQRLLAFARKVEVRFAPIDFLICVRQIVKRLQATLPENIQLTFQTKEKLPSILADPDHIQRILTNLVVNARDAMPDGGNITLSAKVIQFDPILPYFLELEDIPYICLKVDDSGNGMDEPTRLKVFDPFFTTKPGKGDGLGLPEVFGLMRLHNGLIDVQSEPGKGTVVSLFFPLPRKSTVDPKKVIKTPPIQLPEIAVSL